MGKSPSKSGWLTDESYDLDPYGALENEAQLSKEAKSNPVRFQGFTFDSAAELYDMQARHYRPEVARFMSRDRYESSALDYELESDPLTNNLYAFAGGNPVGNVEWDGHRVDCKENPFSQTGGQVCTDDGKPGKNDKVNQGDFLTNTGKTVTKDQSNSLRYNSPGARKDVGYSVNPTPLPPASTTAPSPQANTPGGLTLTPRYIETPRGLRDITSPDGQAAYRKRLGLVADAVGYGTGGWQGAALGVSARASKLGSILNPYSSADATTRSRAAGYLVQAGKSKRWFWVEVGSHGVKGLRFVPLLGAGADFAKDKAIDKRSWIDATLHTSAKVAGGAVGGLAGAAACTTETVASFGAGAVACPVLVGGMAVGGAELSGWTYDRFAPNGR